MATPSGLTVDSLAQAVKAKYPDYASHDNAALVQGLVQKHPEYSQTLHPQELAKITPGTMQAYPRQQAQPGAIAQTLQGAKEFGSGVADIPRSLPQFAQAGNPESVLGSFPEKQVGEGQDYRARAQQARKSGDLLSFIGHSLNAALAPTMIPQTVEGVSQTAQTNPARAAGQIAGMGLMEKAPEKIAGIPDAMRTGAQKTLGVGPEFIRQGAEKVGEENVALEAQTQKLTDRANKANSESQAGFQQRQEHTKIAGQHAQAISDKLPQVHQAARAEAREAYGPQPKGTYDPAEIKTGIQDTAQGKLQGNTALPSAVAKIIKDIDQPPAPTLLDQASVFKGAGSAMRGQGKDFRGTRNVAGDEALSLMDPKARAKFYEQNPEAERQQGTLESTGKTPPLDAQRIHGFMSELGAAAQSGALKPDEFSAINAARGFLEGRLRKLYDNEGRLDDFQAGQAAWKKMAQTFENAKATGAGGSPLARALQTKDAVTGKLRPDYVQAILSDDKAFPVAQEMMNRYKHLGAPTNELEVMKTHGDFADTLPSQVKWKQQPEAPKFGEFDPIEARKVALKQRATTLGGTGGPYGVMRDIMGMKGALLGNPMALTYPILRRLLGSGVGGEGFIKWLSQATPEEMEMAKDIPMSKVVLKRAQKKP